MGNTHIQLYCWELQTGKHHHGKQTQEEGLDKTFASEKAHMQRATKCTLAPEIFLDRTQNETATQHPHPHTHTSDSRAGFTRCAQV